MMKFVNQKGRYIYGLDHKLSELVVDKKPCIVIDGKSVSLSNVEEREDGTYYYVHVDGI